jgi:hypothetical protein
MTKARHRVKKRSWAFSDSKSLGVITTSRVLDEGAPVLLVTHDADDEGWQFLCGTTNDPEDGRIVHLGEMIKMDETLLDVADLPLGWMAERDEVGGEWTRYPNPRQEEDEDD